MPRLTITLPGDLVEEVRARAGRGGVSSWIAQAAAERLGRERLAAAIAEYEAAAPPPHSRGPMMATAASKEPELNVVARRRSPLYGLVGAHLESELGTAMAAIAIPWLVLITTGSAASTGVIGFVWMAPYGTYAALQAVGGALATGSVGELPPRPTRKAPSRGCWSVNRGRYRTAAGRGGDRPGSRYPA